MITRFERFSYAISEISRHWHRIAAQEMGKHGLKAPHSVYLLALARWEAGMTAAQLAQDCGKDKADVSRMVTILEEKGLVCREGASYREPVPGPLTGIEYPTPDWSYHCAFVMAFSTRLAPNLA